MRILPFMVREGEQKHITEPYVSVPPALIITDEAGNIWTLGFKFGPIHGGEYTFNVLCNGIDIGKFANRIERRREQVRILGPDGWETMQVVKQKPIRVYAVGAKLKGLPEIKGPINVKIYFDSRPDIPIVNFHFNPFLEMGGMEDLSATPIICAPGTWLYAIVAPKEDVTVAGYLGDKNLRDIPILKGAL